MSIMPQDPDSKTDTPLIARMITERDACEEFAAAYGNRAAVALASDPPDYVGAATYSQRASAAHLIAVAIQRGLDESADGFRMVPRISLGLRRQLQEFTDNLSERALDEDIPGFQDLADEVSTLYRAASQGICIHCGSYEDCPCDAQADQIETGGY